MAITTTKLATQVLEKAVQNSQSEATKPLENTQSSFQQMLQNTGEEMAFAEMLGVTPDNLLLPNGPTQAISAETIPFDAAGGGGASFQPTGGEKIVDMLSDFNQQQMHMDNLVNEVLYGTKKFSNQELLAIQAHVFQIAQTTELTVKSEELAVSSFKGVMNTQIQ